MKVIDNHRVAIISVDGDPAVEIGQEEAGGQNVYVRQAGLVLAQFGWRVDIFTRYSSALQSAVVELAPNCRMIRLNAGPAQSIGRDDLFDYLPEFVQQFRAFQQQQGWQYSLVHTNYWLSGWVGMELEKYQPLIQVHTHHSLAAVKYSTVEDIPAIATKRLAVEKACLETARRTIATSPQQEEQMRSLVSQQGHIEVIPYGTDLKKFGKIGRAEARQLLGISSQAKVVLYVGRFAQCKGIETLVRAVAQSSLRHSCELKLIIVGNSHPSHSDEFERKRIEGIVASLGISEITIFPGRLDKQLPTYYAAADVCVVPSHYESFGVVAIEAMASRTPVVASDVGGLQFIVVPELTGLLVPPQDEAAFAAAIDRILINPTWRDQLGEIGRLRVEIAFTWKGVVSRLSQLYTNLLAQAALPSMRKTQLAA